MAHLVSGPLAVVRDDTGKLRYYYQGTVLPEDLPAAEVDRLVDIGLVEEFELVEGTVTDVGLQDIEGQTTGDLVVLPRPKAVAGKQSWVDYRVSQGLMLAEDDVELTQLKDDDFMASYKQPAV